MGGSLPYVGDVVQCFMHHIENIPTSLGYILKRKELVADVTYL